MAYTQDELQSYWDACLILQWRRFGTLLDAILQWEAITGCRFSESELLRAPSKSALWKSQVRAFVAGRLPKINDRLLDHGPESDVALLAKLKASKYTTLDRQIKSEMMRAAEREMRANRKNQAIGKLAAEIYKARNRDTDWNVTKASKRHTR